MSKPLTAYVNKAFIEGKSVHGSIILSLDDRRLNHADFVRVNVIPVKVREDKPRLLKKGERINSRCEVKVIGHDGSTRWARVSPALHGMPIGRKGAFRFNPNLPIEL